MPCGEALRVYSQPVANNMQARPLQHLRAREHGYREGGEKSLNAGTHVLKLRVRLHHLLLFPAKSIVSWQSAHVRIRERESVNGPEHDITVPGRPTWRQHQRAVLVRSERGAPALWHSRDAFQRLQDLEQLLENS